MTEQELFEKIKGIIEEKLSVKPGQVTKDASFTEDLGADSLDTVELIMSLEDAFDIEIPDEDAEKLTTVHAVLDYVHQHQPA